jgi:hypothetical protein
MSKINTLITTILLGASSTAIASSYDGYGDYDAYGDYDDDRDRGRRSYFDEWDRDRWYGDDPGPRRYRRAWVPLGYADLADRRERIYVDDRGTFTQLRVQTTGGRAFLDRVIVRFRDGSRQVESVRQILDPSNRWIQFELDGNNRRIDAIVLVGDARRGGLQVFGI